MAIATRIGIAFVAAFMFGVAAVLLDLPIAFGTYSIGDWLIVLPALVVTGFGIFVTFVLVAIARTRITVDPEALDATVVGKHNWLLVPTFRSVHVPFHEIRSVERRTEIFRTLGLSTQRDALSIVTTDGERIGLFSNTLGSVNTLPLDDVAETIAAAAGIPVTDDGTVRTRGSGLYGATSSSWTERPLDPAGARKARRAVALTLQITTALLLLTFVLRAWLRW